MKRNSTIVREINSLFPPTNPAHPVCFEIDGVVKVSGENEVKVSIRGEEFDITLIDYYSDYIARELRQIAKDSGLYWEWDNPGCIVLVR